MDVGAGRLGSLSDRIEGRVPGAVLADVPAWTPTTSMPPMTVTLRGVTVAYRGGRLGLDSVDLRIGAGETVAVLGPNGSGKSTLLRVLATELPPTGGELLLGDLSARRPGSRLRRRIGYAPDEPFHHLPLTGRENLHHFRELCGREAGDDDPALTAFGLDEVADVPVADYSFGMRRKLLLVEVLGRRPELLLLDEPTVGLDPAGLRALEEAVAARAAGGGTVVFASNEIRRAPGWADRVIFLHRGRIVADGAPAELIRKFEGRTLIRVEADRRAGQTSGESHGPGLLGRLAAIRGIVAVDVDGGPPEPVRGDGSPLPGRGTDTFEVESTLGGEPLPELLRTLLDAGRQVRDVRVREPDLARVFEALTGVDLTGNGDSAEVRPNPDLPMGGQR